MLIHSVILEEPPTLYRILNSIANFNNENPVKISNLASATRTSVFDFNYPLSSHVNKAEFEILILNKFMMRRIGFETMTAFKLALNVKLNSIMPIYNKMFDMLDGWDLFNDIETENRSLSNNSNNSINTNANSYSVDDLRNSDMPQNELENIRDGKYITNYNYNQNNNNTASTTNGSQTGNELETITRIKADKIEIYTKFLKNRSSIYDLIFNELNSLFYGLV